MRFVRCPDRNSQFLTSSARHVSLPYFNIMLRIRHQVLDLFFFECTWEGGQWRSTWQQPLNSAVSKWLSVEVKSSFIAVHQGYSIIFVSHVSCTALGMTMSWCRLVGLFFCPPFGPDWNISASEWLPWKFVFLWYTDDESYPLWWPPDFFRTVNMAAKLGAWLLGMCCAISLQSTCIETFKIIQSSCF